MVVGRSDSKEWIEGILKNKSDFERKKEKGEVE